MKPSCLTLLLVAFGLVVVLPFGLKLMRGDAPEPARAPTAAAPTPSTPTRVPVPDTAPVLGPNDAKITLVAWADFECPHSSRARATLKRLEQRYGARLRFVFRHQPLPVHQHAQLAAEASMAAHEQGRFWEYHDLLFASGRLSRQDLEHHAKRLGLDRDRFIEALDSRKFQAVVKQDSAEGTRVGAAGTPTFFINGRKLAGAHPFERFTAEIDAELAVVNKLLQNGTPPGQIYAARMAEAAEPQPAAPPALRPPADETLYEVPVGDSPDRGPLAAAVTLVVFSDFQCFYCNRVVPTLKALEEHYGSRLRVAFKHQPLSFHPHARLAAAASMAAHDQGRFWDYHDRLLENQNALERPDLERYASELGLNLERFNAALDSGKYDAAIARDQALAQEVGASGTPTFFINGRKLVGAQPLEAFKAQIDRALSEAAQ
jgi:protein-disulfide isomerase